MAIELDRNYNLAYYNRGYAYEEIGDYENALADYKRALKLVTTNK